MTAKNMYYYGLKLHFLAFRRPGTIPFPELIGVTAASENDLMVAEHFDFAQRPPVEVPHLKNFLAIRYSTE
jgi:hypothetical protein